MPPHLSNLCFYDSRVLLECGFDESLLPSLKRIKEVFFLLIGVASLSVRFFSIPVSIIGLLRDGRWKWFRIFRYSWGKLKRKRC